MSAIVVLGRGGGELRQTLEAHGGTAGLYAGRRIYVAFPDALPDALALIRQRPDEAAGLVRIEARDCRNTPGLDVPCPVLPVPAGNADALAVPILRFCAGVPIEWSRREHRAIETHLDRLLDALRNGLPWREHFREAWRLASEHYPREDAEVFQPKRDWPPARKMMAQHAEAAEFGQVLTATADADADRLARRFHAISQHNIIEEERDVFPCLICDYNQGTAAKGE